MTLSSLGVEYLNWFRSLTRKVRDNAFVQLLFGTLVFLFSQLCLVLAFFLPLKVIIMVGTEGIPRYLRLIVDESNKNDYITLFAVLAVCFYILFLLSEVLLGKLGKSAARKILARSKKITLFEQQSDFARDVFLRVVRTWATVFMVVAGFILGFVLEWRIFAVLSIVVILEFFLLSRIWLFCQMPENANTRAQFVNNRAGMLNALSAVNFFVGFAVLFYLFITKAVVNFIIGILLILLLRQIFQRMAVAINDAVFLTQQRAKITGLFYTHSHFEQGKHHVTVTFEERLKPESRSDWLKSFTAGNEDLTALEWVWFDSSEKGTALFTAMDEGQGRQYWLKLYPANKEGAFEQSKTIYQALQSPQVEHAPVLMAEGFQTGMYYVLLATQPEVNISARSRKKVLNEWMIETWKTPPPAAIANMLERSLPPLGKRLNYSNLSLLMIATCNRQEQKLVAELSELADRLAQFVNCAPKFLRNTDLSEMNTLYQGNGKFALLHWHKVGIDPVCSNIQLTKLGDTFKPKEIAEQLRIARTDCVELTTDDIKKIVHLSSMDRFLSQGHYRAAFELVAPILRLFND